MQPALRALWDIDLAFADVVSTTITLQLGAIRLAWWRERLEDLDKGIAPPPEPRLQSVAETLIPAGIAGEELSRLEYCWLALLTPFPWGGDVVDAVAERGAVLFGIGARLLGRQAAEGAPYGIAWSLADVARRCSDEQSRTLLRKRAKAKIASLAGQRVPRELRPLLMVVFLSAYALLNTDRHRLHRIFAGLRYLLFGQMPRS